jgi:hypothetical protein
MPRRLAGSGRWWYRKNHEIGISARKRERPGLWECEAPGQFSVSDMAVEIPNRLPLPQETAASGRGEIRQSCFSLPDKRLRVARACPHRAQSRARREHHRGGPRRQAAQPDAENDVGA